MEAQRGQVTCSGTQSKGVEERSSNQGRLKDFCDVLGRKVGPGGNYIPILVLVAVRSRLLP